jgi:hypothetical protein
MTLFKYHLSFAHKYFTEMFTMLMFGVLLDILNTSTIQFPIISLAIFFILQWGFSYWIVRHFDLKYIYVLTPIFIIILIFFGHYWLTAIILPTVSAFRLEQLYNSLEHSLAELSVVCAFILLILINIFQLNALAEYTTLFHILFIFMILFYFLGKLIVLLSDHQYQQKSTIYCFTLISVLLLILASLIMPIYKYFSSLIHWVIAQLLNIFAVIISPVFNALEELEFNPPDIENQENEGTEENFEELFDESSQSFLNIDGSYIIIFVLVLGICITLFLYFKRRDVLHKQSVNTKSVDTYINQNTEQKKLRKIQPPEHRIRKEYFYFEKWLAKKGLGRYYDETIEEWVRRLDLKSIINQRDLNKYQQYRYRDTDLDEAEFLAFKESIDNIKQQLKSWRE